MSDDIRDEQLSRLYREAGAAEPPSALDAAILTAAREAVAPRPRRRAWWQRWAAPVGVAATAVLTVTLTLLVRQEQAVREQLPSPPEAPRPAPDQMLPQIVPAVPAARPRAEPILQDAESRAPARTSELPRQAAPPAAAETKLQQPVPAAAGAVAPRAVPAESLESAAPAPAPVQKREAAPAADAVEMRAKTLLRKDTPGANAARSPEQWLEDIRRLKRQGRQQEAAESLAEFRKAYPDFGLPEDLR